VTKDAVPLEVMTASAEETAALGATLARWLRDGDVVLLHGDLGAGKTTLVNGIAAGLGVGSVVSSPTFGLVSEYEAAAAAPIELLYHLDLFRLHDEADLDSIGYAELIAPTAGAVVVEWPERAGSTLPDRFLLVELEFAGESHRRLRFSLLPDGPAWRDRRDVLETLLRLVAPSQALLSDSV
jgi:tRNA threonylcarbamoyladenosine biosynthesis protein TsaE